MLVAVGNKGLDLNSDEKIYLDKLRKAFPEDDFSDLFSVDSNYQITSVIPPHNKSTSMILIFFFLNVMMNQRIRVYEKALMKISKLEERIIQLEKGK